MSDSNGKSKDELLRPKEDEDKLALLLETTRQLPNDSPTVPRLHIPPPPPPTTSPPGRQSPQSLSVLDGSLVVPESHSLGGPTGDQSQVEPSPAQSPPLTDDVAPQLPTSPIPLEPNAQTTMYVFPETSTSDYPSVGVGTGDLKVAREAEKEGSPSSSEELPSDTPPIPLSPVPVSPEDGDLALDISSDVIPVDNETPNTSFSPIPADPRKENGFTQSLPLSSWQQRTPQQSPTQAGNGLEVATRDEASPGTEPDFSGSEDEEELARLAADPSLTDSEDELPTAEPLGELPPLPFTPPPSLDDRDFRERKLTLTNSEVELVPSPV